MKKMLRGSSSKCALALGSVAIISTVLLSSCSLPNAITEKSEKAQEAVVGNATPAHGAVMHEPEGQVVSLKHLFDENAELIDMEQAGDILALRSQDKLIVAKADAFLDAHPAPDDTDLTTLEIDKSCGDLTATKDTFVLACPSGVALIDAQKPQLDNVIPSEQPLNTAALSSDGTIAAGIKDTAEVVLLDAQQKKKIAQFPVSYPTDELISVPIDTKNKDEKQKDKQKSDAFVRINRQYSIIQDLDWKNKKAGAMLRVGKGVGSIKPAEDGLLLASDNVGNQLALYFADDVIRLQKTIGVYDAPWAVAWDKNTNTAWVHAGAHNKAFSYDPSSGDLIQKQSFGTIADVRNMAVLSDGRLVFASTADVALEFISPQKN
ncbi:hypothetical protein EML15_00440 [Corynebacterium sp. sy017]|uniref:hypothetical protein n=1 Tax=unclassified Corynebacterium TaxID=2624378 RepID=UPI001184AD04|nr:MULTISPECIES: hypothetical protein [unclassified Corynebacterium]MBP3087623.1 hypothetical protein [Corynebacterium sp. sy017]TSD92189.1 hypothetical protein ELY17_00440 [Corynebacterium sp. SY003]